MDKLRMESPDLTAQNIDRIAALFPNCITEMLDEERSTPEKKVYKRAVNFELLKQMLSPDVVDGDEAYEFTWVGKKAAIVEANKPIRKTLRPCVAESKDWDATENLYIEGDNLEVLKLLQESYLGKVKMIYIDPPYNTGKNYIYRNDFSIDSAEYDDEAGIVDDDGARLVANPIGAARFHSAWMSMIYQRLLVARNLLSPDGIMVVAIDENEFASLATMIKEVFGESGYAHSYVSIVHNPRGQQGINFSYVNEYLIFVYPNNGKKYLADFPKDEVDSRTLRDSGTESDRTDARMCFYPFYVKGNKIIRIGDVPDNSFHPLSANVVMDDGCIDVAVYVKLPDSFYIATPIGHYNPDWAIAFYEGTVKHIYFVAETKGSMSSMQLRLIEESKIHCAREHFKAISSGNVVYDVVDSYQTLLERVMK